MRSRLKISGKFEAVLSSTLNYQPPTASCTTLRHFAPPRSDFERPLPFLRGLCVKSFCLPWKFHPQFRLRSNGQFDQIRPNSTKKYFCCVRNLGWNFHHKDHFCWAIPDFQSLLYRRALQERPDSAAGDDCRLRDFQIFSYRTTSSVGKRFKRMPSINRRSVKILEKVQLEGVQREGVAWN